MFEAPMISWEQIFASRRLVASDVEVLEVSWAPGSDQGNFKKISKSSKVTIH